MSFRFLSIILIAIFVSSCTEDCQQVKSYYANGNKKQIRYFSDCNKKWNYKKYYLDENGIQLYQGEFVNGLENGRFKTWTKHGILTADWTMINGKSNGLTQCWYDNGIKKMEINTVRGIDHGPFTDWDEDGTLYCKGHYKFGKRDSLWIYFGEHGTIEKKYYKNDSLIGDYYDKYFDSDSVLLVEKGQYSNDEKTGIWKTFYPDKTIKYERQYINGKLEGEFKKYYKNGSIESKIPYKNSNRMGLAKWYYKTGEIEQTIVYINNLRTITTKYFTNGVISELNHYTSDTIIERKLAKDINGNITLKNGTGIVYDYFNSGELQYKGEYVNSKRTGIAKWFYKNGQLMESSLFKDNKVIEILNAYHEDGTDRDFEQKKKLE